VTKNIKGYIEKNKDEAIALLISLAQIPAPSNNETMRAEFILNWLNAQGISDAYIDDKLNVVYPIGINEDNPVYVFMAHTDVVFADEDALPVLVEEKVIRCPGICDNTANVVALMMAAKYITNNNMIPQNCGVVIVFNSGEEGLGNLKGCRKIMEQFRGRVVEFISFDSPNRECVSRSVGSKRYRIEVITKGGHSYNNFGEKNAIEVLANIISKLYLVNLPPKGKTTYNVGVIEGGTSVNTIAQKAHMLYEYRSDDEDSLLYMERYFKNTIKEFESEDVKIIATLVGERPCAQNIDKEKQANLKTRAAEVYRSYYGNDICFVSGSTDCNIPMSEGIPSVCVGCCIGRGAHTREEYVEIDSIAPGMGVCCELITHCFEKRN